MFDMKVKQAATMFFDSKRVISATDRATRKVLSKFGAFVRRTARGLIRKRKRPSKPGQAPSSRTGLLRDNIFFGYEPNEQTVVIGPAKLNAKKGDVPEALESGGLVTISHGKHRGEHFRIEPRPYIGPAYEANEPKLPDMWADSVK